MSNKDILILGGLVLDRYIMVDKWPERSQDAFFSEEHTFTGGCAINMAVTAKNLGADVHLVSIVGDDEDGRVIKNYLEEHDFSIRHIVITPEEQTGKCLVFSEPDGERTFLTKRGAEDNFPESLAKSIESQEYAAIGLTGYYLLSDQCSRIVETIRVLKSKGSKLLFDPSPLVGSIDKNALNSIIEMADIVTPNKTELEAFGGEDAIQELVKSGKTVVYKMGSEGGHVYTPATDFKYHAVGCCKAVDTTGAGDSFSGALLYGMSTGKDIAYSIKIAAECAAKTCTVFGPHGFWNLED